MERLRRVTRISEPEPRRVEPRGPTVTAQTSIGSKPDHSPSPEPGKLRLLLCCLLMLLSPGLVPPVRCQLYVDLDKPRVAKMPAAVPDFVSQEPGPVSGRDLAAIVKNDLHLTGLFQIVEAASPTAGATGGEPDFDAWTQTGTQILVLGTYQVREDQLVVEAKLYDVPLKKLLLAKRYTGRVTDHRQMIHRFGDRVMEQLTQIPGCFSSRIAFVDASRTREIFAMDFDGRDLRQLTHNGSLNMSPEWSPDGSNILFTSYSKGNPDLWLLDLGTMRPFVVSSRRGINASARYSPDGAMIALSLSMKAIPKIFILSMQGNIIKELTDGRGNDISPAWSPDGANIAYVSDQAGAPQIYIVSAAGGRPRRLTIGSPYNTDPDWSPRGDLIAFTSRIEGRFQICTIKADGTDFRVLTSKGSNEEPAWSPDGRMIAFASNRDGKRLIYVMDARGEIQVPVSPFPGKAPAWSRNSR
jgi:TolB protein